MVEIEYVHSYLFDIFEKGADAQNIITKLNQKYGQYKEDPRTVKTLGSPKKVQETKYLWEVIDTQRILDEAECVCKEKLDSDLTLSRRTITKISIIGIQNEELPYFTLVMSISIDKTKLNLEQFFGDLTSILRPLRIFFEEFNGITRRYFESKPICPFFIDLRIFSPKEELTQLLQTAREIMEAENIPHESRKKEYLIPLSAKLRKTSPLSSLPYNFNLISIPQVYSNVLSFMGQLDQTAYNGFMTSFNVVFESEKQWNDTDADPYLTIRSSGYDLLFAPWGASGTIFYLTTMYAWLLHRMKTIDDFGDDLNKLESDVRKIVISRKKSKLEEHLIKLDKQGSLLTGFQSEINKLQRINDDSLRDFMRGKTSTATEIPLLPPTNGFSIWYSITDYTGSGAFLQSLTRLISAFSQKINDILKQHNSEIEKIHSHTNNLVSIQTQKTMKKHSEAMLFMTLIIGIATIVLLYDALQQSSIENAPPEITATGGQIILEGGLRPTFKFPEGIAVGAASTHNLKFTVVNAELNYVNGDTGNCFFESQPKVSLWHQPSVTVKTDDDLKSIHPDMSIDYSVRSSFTGMVNTTNSLGYVVGSVKFSIFVIDMQDPSKKYLEQASSDLIVHWPEDRMTEAVKLCKLQRIGI